MGYNAQLAGVLTFSVPSTSSIMLFKEKYGVKLPNPWTSQAIWHGTFSRKRNGWQWDHVVIRSFWQRLPKNPWPVFPNRLYMSQNKTIKPRRTCSSNNARWAGFSLLGISEKDFIDKIIPHPGKIVGKTSHRMEIFPKGEGYMGLAHNLVVS